MRLSRRRFGDEPGERPGALRSRIAACRGRLIAALMASSLLFTGCDRSLDYQALPDLIAPASADLRAPECIAGMADCDHWLVNGCEVHLEDDFNHCGRCDVTCVGLQKCVNGKCLLECAPGSGDCDGDARNGCETLLDRNELACGACGNVCPAAPHADPICRDGTCKLVCVSGWGDCDMLANTGCETDLITDPANCRACGVICPVRPNAVAASCVKGQCENVCQPGFVDCDGNAANGCEANPMIDRNNCGGCGHVCAPGKICVGGMCV